MMDRPHPQVLQRLGALPVARFMRETWQRRPLVIRSAIAGFQPPFDRARLFELARHSDAEARLVERDRARWRVSHGPFARLPSTRRPGWTVLVQGLDLLDVHAHALLQRFRFIPDARLDDLMASYATDGGGVGPHVDSYDVFLLQTLGRRRWRIGRQRDLRTVDGAPLQILADFRPTQEMILGPGDLLYLPPGVAHEGTALGECITCSIGFRAPTHQELLAPYYADLADHAALRGRYRDPGSEPTRRPGALPAAMVEQLHAALAPRAAQGDTARFLLGYLSEPKAQIVFDRPPRALGRGAFAARAATRGVELDRRTRMLYRGGSIGINGQVCSTGRSGRTALQQLADRRRLAAAPVAGAIVDLLHDWYRCGWLHIAGTAR